MCILRGKCISIWICGYQVGPLGLGSIGGPPIYNRGADALHFYVFLSRSSTFNRAFLGEDKGHFVMCIGRQPVMVHCGLHGASRRSTSVGVLVLSQIGLSPIAGYVQSRSQIQGDVYFDFSFVLPS